MFVNTYNVFKSLCKTYATEAKNYNSENDKTKKLRHVLEFILKKYDFRKMGTSTLGPKVTDHPSKENVTVISQEINEEKPLIIHIDTSNEVPTFKFNPFDNFESKLNITFSSNFLYDDF
mgnify:CR=1 FL=1